MYDEFYSLKGRPFRLSPDPRFLFRSKVHNKALSYLRYGLQTGEGFVVITGGVGTGKTTLARLILSKINKSKIIAVELVTSRLESDDMLRLVAAALGLAHQDLLVCDAEPIGDPLSQRAVAGVVPILEKDLALFFENGIGTFPEVVDGQRIRSRIAAGKIDGRVSIHGSLFF